MNLYAHNVYVIIIIIIRHSPIHYTNHSLHLQHSKRLTHIIIGTFHPFGSCYLIFKIINTHPMHIYIINLMNSITPTYNTSNVFIIICIKIVHLMESIFSCVCPLVSYDIILVFSCNELLLLLLIISPKGRYTNILLSFALWLSYVYMYAAYQLISIYILVCQSNDLIMLCSIHVHYLSIINPHPLIHVHIIVHHTCYTCISMFKLY